jgi:SET domain-containing protein
MLQLIKTVHRRKQTVPGEGKKSPSLSVKKSPIHGLGCFASVRFLKDNRIAEYAGEKISRKEAMQRMKRPDGKRISELEAEWYIDGSVDGNQTQYINHSCDPNADAFVIGGSLVIFALREIAPGEEITVGYLNSFEQDQSVCQCRTVSCCQRIIEKAA